ncbi:hypothetical protein M2132_002345 [Dysgonomonas sp. PH5-45]|nr:hypothetical protein [Dysgonomonas sp. PH5-45]MDH6388889.1 hypothetical protein [Dysgonomonas sp. PH5-37]
MNNWGFIFLALLLHNSTKSSNIASDFGITSENQVL